MIAQRCFAALGNFSKMKYIKNLYKIKKNNIIDTNNKNDNNIIEKKINQIIVDAKILLLKKKFDEAKKLLLDNNLIQEAIDIFKEIHKYLDAIEIGEQYKLPESELMKKEYYGNLPWRVRLRNKPSACCRGEPLLMQKLLAIERRTAHVL